jgi:phosphohistidine phosphatase
MRTLLLLRHAKSSWADPQLEDFERPLNSRGLEATSALAAHFFVTKLQPDLVLCSAALRTRATLAGLLPAFAHDYRISVENRLYLASASKLLERLHEIDEGTACVLLIGHNPGLERLARLLAGSGPPEKIEAMHNKFPTAALAVFEFDSPKWRDIGKGSGKLADYRIPADLED